MSKVTILMAIYILLINITTSGQSSDEKFKIKIDALFEKYDNQESPGAAVVIVKGDRTIYQNEFGMANLEYTIPITPITVFHIGSVSKQFTAFAILLLEYQEKLSQEDYIGKYLPDFNESKIKIHHLIHHTSGLREIESLLQLSGISSADVIEQEQLLRLIKQQGELNFIPGDALNYCNTGYVILAKIVEKVTGESFRQWTRKKIFEPLGMRNTFFYDDCTEIVKNRAYPYWIPDENKIVKGILNYSYVGPTSLFTTSEDIAKWLMNFSNPNIDNKLITKRMLNETDTLNTGKIIDYGFGLGVTTHNGNKVILHSGHDAGYRSADLYFPEQKLGIAILSNFYSINPMKYGFMIADMLLNKPTQKLESADVTIEGSKEIESIVPQIENLQEYVGQYYNKELQVGYNIEIDQGELIVQHWRNEDVILIPAGNDQFSGNQWWIENIGYVRNHTNKIIGFNITARGIRTLYFKKI